MNKLCLLTPKENIMDYFQYDIGLASIGLFVYFFLSICFSFFLYFSLSLSLSLSERVCVYFFILPICLFLSFPFCSFTYLRIGWSVTVILCHSISPFIYISGGSISVVGNYFRPRTTVLLY